MFTDGPFVESKEYLAGFWIIEAPDLDVPLRLAADGSKACLGQRRTGHPGRAGPRKLGHRADRRGPPAGARAPGRPGGSGSLPDPRRYQLG
jgi:hypothetical protein